jgi:hypothetical protein
MMGAINTGQSFHSLAVLHGNARGDQFIYDNSDVSFFLRRSRGGGDWDA